MLTDQEKITKIKAYAKAIKENRTLPSLCVTDDEVAYANGYASGREVVIDVIETILEE